MRVGIRRIVGPVALVALLLTSGAVALGSPRSPDALAGSIQVPLSVPAPATPYISAAPPSGPTVPGPVPTPSAPTGAPALGVDSQAAHTLSALRSAGVPLRYAFLPAFNRAADLGTGGVVGPTYTTAPAPIGVADYGVSNVSGTLVPADLSTSRVEGIFAPTSFSGLSMDTGAPDYYGVQLNAVLQDVTLFGNSSYSFWTQNVIEYSTYSQQLTLLDNLWNFSTPTTQLSDNALYSHGANGTQVGTTYYYALGPTITVGYPFTLRLFLNSTIEDNRDVVYANYTLTNATVHRGGSYDELVFNSVGGGSGTTPSPEYIADGATANALGLPNDFELTIGGPGGGSNFDAFDARAAVNLYYWNTAAGAFAVVPSAYDVGGDTGETAAGLSSTWAPGADSALGGTGGPAALLTQGPSELFGEWNVSDATAGATTLHLRLAPSNGFVFLGRGATAPDSAYQWVPPAGPYVVSPGEYSLAALASHFAPQSGTIDVTGASFWENISLAADAGAGVYTPLWALSSSDLANISSTCAGGTCTLWNDESGALGRPNDGTAVYPWFGSFNDFLFPEFPGVLLWHVSQVLVASPPSLEVATPSWLLNETSRLGTPPTNELPFLFYDDSSIQLAGAAAIAGWWFEGAWFGASGAQASVVFWNTTDSTVSNDTFLTSAAALYFYGGGGNTVVGDTFLSYGPLAPNAGSIAGNVFGTTGLFEADPGTSDLVYNNAFGTYYTAVEPVTDPYTDLAAPVPYEARWNVTPTPGRNIAGGAELGGNYWWNFGQSTDPYWVFPYNASGAISYTGDFHPLLPSPLWTLTFQEQGLPGATPWEVGIETDTGYAYNSTTGTSLTEPWPSGYFFLTAQSLSGAYGISTTEVIQVTGANATILLQFYRLFTLAFNAENLPAGGFWTVTVWSPLGSWIDLGNVADFPPQALPEAVYNFTISPSPGYQASPGSGTVDLTQNLTVDIDFSPAAAPGTLSGSVTPASGATLLVDGQVVGVASGGGFSVHLDPGLHSVEVTESGYASYFNNVSIAGGQTTTLNIVLVAQSTSGTYELLFIAAGAAAVLLGVLAVVFYVRGRRPPTPASTGNPPPSM